MSALERGKVSTKTTIRLTSLLCVIWSTIIGSLVFLSLKVEFPFDIVAQPLAGVKILSLIVVTVHFVLSISLSAVSSAQTKSGGASRFRIKNVAKCLGAIAAACIIFHAMAILFGAPLVESSRETFHFAMLLTSLVIVPPFFILGVDGEKWIAVYAQGRPSLGKETVIYTTSISSLVGAWLGAVPIPLDWDRPWQVWPVSCVLGSLFGYCLGLLISAIYLPLRHRQLLKTKLT